MRIPRILKIGFIVAVLFGFAVFALLRLTADPKRAAEVQVSYLPVSDKTAFEFTVEYVGAYEDGAMAFGLVTKGTLHEGYRLQLIRQNGERKDCVCRAIAGLSRRPERADADGPDVNVGIWLDIAPEQLAPRDRLVSFDALKSARRITGVHKGDLKIGTKVEYYHLIEEPPKFLNAFRSVVDGELRTFFFSRSDGTLENGKYSLEGDSHFGFARLEGDFAIAFQQELKSNPALKP